MHDVTPRVVQIAVRIEMTSWMMYLMVSFFIMSPTKPPPNGRLIYIPLVRLCGVNELFF